MSRHWLTCGVALALLIFGGRALAQDSRIITFKEAVRIALEQNTTLRAAQNAAALGKVDVSEARGQFLPDLRLSTQGSKNFGRNFDQTAGTIVDQSSNSVSLGVSSGVTLFDGFGNIASLRQAQLFDRAGEGDLQRVRETVVFTVASNFLALIQGQEQLHVQRENLSAAAALEQQIQTYVDAGARTIADLYQQQAVVASARVAVVDAERTAELAKVDLMQTLQLDPGGNYEFESPADTTSTAAAESFQLDDLLKRATAQRIDLEAEKARVDAAQQAVRIARSNRWPTVSLSAGYSSAYNSASPFSFSDQLDQRRGGSVGVGVSVPLFDRGSTSAATRRAEIQADNANLSLISLQQEVGLQVRRVYLDFRAAQEQLVAAESQVRAAELALQAAQDRYTAGASTLVELTQSRAAQVEAASSLVSARYNLLFERTLVDYYVGDLDPGALSAN
jgi:outer membrane protein